MDQRFIVETKAKKMFVMSGNNLVKIIDDVRFGKNGVCDFSKMKEGGNKTPLGKYNLGIAFGIHDLDIDYPYIKIDDNSYWVDDVNSNFYNCFVQIGDVNNFGYSYVVSGNKNDFSSAEHLIDYSKSYEYAIFTGYNISNIKGRGSAIFLHCHGGEFTAGCISISREDMKWLLKYIDRSLNPVIEIK